ncbi:MAG: hypothetical protein Q7J47_16310 [Azoarcus sp.]|nr:hypothetical protein [Azoarcus sp.]
MFRKLITALGFGGAAMASAAAGGVQGPYAEAQTNLMYNLMFCDNAALFKPQTGAHAADWQAILFADRPDPGAIAGLAADEGQESRVRILAYNWLSANGRPVPGRRLLGVVVEVPVQGGLDTLAVYPDGRIRYINHSGKMALFDAVPSEVATKIAELMASSQLAVDRLNPWNKPRLPASKENVRMSFLASDGLYFGEGPFAAMEREPMAAPILMRASELLQFVVKVGVK